MANNLNRRPLIAGNWKMNTNLIEGVKLAEEIVNTAKDAKAEVIICPPFTHLASIQKVISNTNVTLGAQNMYFEKSGAYTGEISPVMLKSTGCKYVIIGHSERREIFSETNDDINKKVHSALAHQLLPIIAVGETLQEREEGKTEEKIKNQISESLKNIKQLKDLVFAYEPIWAIGSGKTATPEQANDVVRYIRAILSSLYTHEQAQRSRILYGGSVNTKNIDILMSEPEIDGALVGGASLDAISFARIVKFK